MVRYSQAFKSGVVEQISSGSLSIIQAKELYGINGGSTVYRWIQQAGRDELITKVINVRTSSEVDEIKRLKKELAQAKRALAETQIDKWIHSELYEHACRSFGVDPSEFKKKVEPTLSKESGK